MKTVDWREWAKNDKASVCEIANIYAGDFVKALMEVYIRADILNTAKIINTWEEEFKRLHSFYLGS